MLVIGMADFVHRSGLPRDYCYAAAKTGRLKAIRSGKRWLVISTELEDFLSRELAARESDVITEMGGA
jgi:excisionase family DNA binding protein